MSIEDDIAFLERLPILRSLGAPALRILAIGVESYGVQAGQILFEAGENADCAYIVRQGSFTLQPQLTTEPDVIVQAGTLLGETALFADTRRAASAFAREDSVVLRVSRAMFLKVLESFPDAAVRLRNMIAGRTDQFSQELEKVRSDLLRGTRQP